MLAPMNPASSAPPPAPPSHFADYGVPGQKYHPHPHAHPHHTMLEPQHDDLDVHPHYGHHAHPHGLVHGHSGQTHGSHTHTHHAFGLSHWSGAYTDFDRADDGNPEDDHDFDDEHHDPEADHSEDAYGHYDLAAAAPPSKSSKPRKAELSASSSATSSSSSTKKEVFICPEVHCGKTFPRSFALRRHMRIHTGNKPYACDFAGCTQRFNTSGNLSRHKRIHSGERPYPCVFSSCGKRFNTSTKLKRHMRIHFPDGQSLFHCVQHACTFACDNYKEYVHHQRQHGNPAYAATPKGDDDENLDQSNFPVDQGKTKVKTKRVSKGSKAAAAATTAALHGDFMRAAAPPLHQAPLPSSRGYNGSPSTSAASGLSMLMKEAHRENDLDAEYLDHRRPPPRLPFPTGAFPSESIASAPSMNLNLSATFGSTFSGRSSSSSYYDHASSAGYSSSSAVTSSSSSSSFPSYLRGPVPPSDVYGHHQHHHSGSGSGYFPPLRPEDADDQYDSTSPRSNQDDEDAGYNSVPHPVGSDFTGEELSAVLELMKDS